MKQILSIIIGLFAMIANAGNYFGDRTVMVAAEKTGGSGVILNSTTSASYVLTNKHICAIGKYGQLYVHQNENKYIVNLAAISKFHDLCVIKVIADLGKRTFLARTRAKFGEQIVISGHPFLMPTMIVTGVMSKDMTAALATFSICTNKYVCRKSIIPQITYLDAQTSSASIAGGNSGSGVFNTKGELVALVFAGYGMGMSPSVLVPYEYIRNFLTSEKLEWKSLKDSKVHILGKSTSLNNLIEMDNVVFPAIKSKLMKKFKNVYKILKQKGQ